MRHNTAPDWFYPDELDVETGMGSLQVYTFDSAEDAGRLFITVDGGGGGETADLTYHDAANLQRYLAVWMMWAEDQEYDE